MTTSTQAGCRREIATLQILLSTSNDHDDAAVMDLINKIEAKSASGSSGFHVLTLLKSMLVSATSLKMETHIMQLFLKKISLLIEELVILKKEEMAKQALVIVKDFWTLCSNQQVVISQQRYRHYAPEFYEVLPSLASVFTDLFIAVHRGKNKKKKFASRLCSWLMFELNERCLKTALLEVADCTPDGALFLLPLLRKLLSDPPQKDSNLDYLLHFVLLKRWAFACTELKDIIQLSLNVKPPKNFVEWLCKHWPQAKEVVPTDKSLKGRRVSELMLDLDQKAVEELIEVFSQILWSADQGIENVKADGEEMEQQMFVIDKTGSDNKKKENATDGSSPPKKRKKKEEIVEKEVDVSDVPEAVADSDGDSDIFMLPGLLDDTRSDASNDSIDTETKQKNKSERNNTSLPSAGYVIYRSSNNKQKASENGLEECMDIDEMDSDEESFSDKNDRDEKRSSGAKRTDMIQTIDSSEDSDDSVVECDLISEDEIGPREKGQETPKNPVQGYFVDRKSNKDAAALSYFVDKSGGRKSDSKSEGENPVQVIDGMEVQIYVSEEMPISTEKENSGALSLQSSGLKEGEKIQVKSPRKSESPSKKRILRNDSAEDIESTADSPNKNLRSKHKEDVIDITGSEMDADNSGSEELMITKVDATLSSSFSPSMTFHIEGARRNNKKSPFKNTSQDDDVCVLQSNSAEFGKHSKLRKRSNGSIEENSRSGGDGLKNTFDLTTEEQIGNVLTQIRKSVDTHQGSKSQSKSAVSKPSKLTTRLRSKSESSTDGIKSSEKGKKRQTTVMSKTSSQKNLTASASESILTEWLRKTPDVSVKNANQTEESDQSTPVRKLGKKSMSESSQGNKSESEGTFHKLLSTPGSPNKRGRKAPNETLRSSANTTGAEDKVFGQTLKTYSKKDGQATRSGTQQALSTPDLVVVESDSESSISTPKRSGKAKKSPLKRTYYLRTPHKTSPHAKTDCSACSTENEKPVKIEDESSELRPKSTPKSTKKSGSSSLPGSPNSTKTSSGNRRKSLRSSRK